MPALVRTNYSATVTWLGLVPDRNSSLQSKPATDVYAAFAGVTGEDHAGLTRVSCGRVTTQYPRGTEIRNVRQFSIVCAEELQKIAIVMGVPAIDPAWIGASMVIRGIPDFSHVPPSARLQNEVGTTLTIDMQNRPCHLPAKVIDEHVPGFGKGFKPAAGGLRGVTGWVEREGPIRLGDIMVLHIPEQRGWAPE